MFTDFVIPKLANLSYKPKGPYAFAQTRITRTPHIIAEGGFGQDKAIGMYMPGVNPNKIARSFREDLPSDMYPNIKGYITTPSIKDPDYNREVISHESMHGLLDNIGLGTISNKRKDITDNVVPNVPNELVQYLKDNSFLGWVPKGTLAHEGLGYAIENPTTPTNQNTLLSLAETLYKAKDLKSLETLQKLVTRNVAGVKDKERRARELEGIK
jgi:hypothetical protein